MRGHGLIDTGEGAWRHLRNVEELILDYRVLGWWYLFDSCVNFHTESMAPFVQQLGGHFPRLLEE